MTSVSFNDSSQSQHVARERAEMYTRIYQYAAEDFSTIPDVNNFAKDVIRWAKSVEQRLDKLGKELEKHTHRITAHYHMIETHSHIVPIHTHGGPVSPSPPIQTGTNQAAFHTKNDIQSAIESKKANNRRELPWPVGTLPVEPMNSTGAISNIAQNLIVQSKGVLGDISDIHSRRKLTIPILMVPDVPPVVTIGAGI